MHRRFRSILDVFQRGEGRFVVWFQVQSVSQVHCRFLYNVLSSYTCLSGNGICGGLLSVMQNKVGFSLVHLGARFFVGKVSRDRGTQKLHLPK